MGKKKHEPNQALEALDEVVVTGLALLGAIIALVIGWVNWGFWVGAGLAFAILLPAGLAAGDRKQERIDRDRRKR